MAFTEVASVPERNVLGAWGGWQGEGVGGQPGGALGSLFAGTGSRAPGGGGSSRVFRLDTPDGSWVDDGAPSGAETISKMRSGIDPASGDMRLWAFYESPKAGQTWLIWRAATAGPGRWGFEHVPTEGGDVGGEGLGVPLGGTEPILYAGASQKWDQADQRQGQVFRKESNGSWTTIRSIGPAFGHHVTLMWAIEYDGRGRHWQFWNDFGQAGAESATFINNIGGTPPSPGGDISDCAWFDGGSDGGWMYTVGALKGSDTRNAVYRIQNGSGTEWELAHKLEVASLGDHVLYVPRGTQAPGELWVIGHDPLEATRTLDGKTWTREMSIPAVPTGSDSNHLTAIAYYAGAVWILSRDAGQNRVRVWRDEGGGQVGGRRSILQVI
jgi:hypothetical protein